MTYHIVGAGAGSGKTHRIQTMLAEWVANATVRPERILAVTFTEAAAAELKGRIRAALLADGRHEEAMALGRAYVSTIHALGQRLLTEHAFAAGISPALRPIEDAEAELLLRRAIAEAEGLDGITADLAAHGYVWTRNGGSAEDAFRRDLRAAIKRLDEIGDRGDDLGLPARAAKALRKDWPNVAEDGATLDTALRRAIEAMLNAFPDGIVEAGNTAASLQDFERDISALRRGREADAYTDWSWWQGLRNIRTTNRRTATPEGYDDLAGAVREAASALPRHPGPREQAAARLEALLAGAQDVRRRFREAKARLGAVDFGDMIARAEALLRDDPDAIAATMEGVDCVIVDEFQDTNPVQFALLTRLVAAAPRVLLVGDGKQAVMGFQGADARLSQALADAHPEATETQESNWRSVPGIMALVNDLGTALFKNYASLSPTREPAGDALPIEVLRVPKNRAPAAKGCHHVAVRIAALLDEGRQVEDPATKRMRPIAPGDIAVLVRSHDAATAYAEQLTRLGIPVDLTEGGWSASPAISVLCAALSFVADPGDRHAAMLLLTHGPARMAIEDALVLAVEGTLEQTAALAPFRDLAEAAADWPVTRTVAALCAPTILGDWAAGLPDPARVHADLSRMGAEAAAFETADPVTRGASGVFGWDARSFLAWLAIRIEADREGDSRPHPGAGTARGVRLSTWHSAKGLEWPVVVVAGLFFEVGERPNTLRIEYDGWEDPGTLLDRATVRYHPAAAAPEVAAHFVTERREAAAATERCLSYVALTRARDLLILEWPDHCKEDADTVSNLLVTEGGLDFGDGAVNVGGTNHSARIETCPEMMPDAFDGNASDARTGPCAGFGRRVALPDRGAPFLLRPSEGGEEAGIWSLEALALGGVLAGDAAGGGEARERGTALHLTLRALMQAPGRKDAVRAASGLPEATIGALAEQGKALTALLDARGLTERLHELPFDVVRADGVRIRGTADLVARSPNGSRAALIDFKSPAPSSPIEAVEPFLSQIDAYADAARTLWPEMRIERAGVHFLGSGTLVWGEPGG